MRYEFEKIDEAVKVVPMSTLFCKRIMDRFRKEMKGKIKPLMCYENAVLAAKWLNERGFDVEIAEGLYKPSEIGAKVFKGAIDSYTEEHQELGNSEYDEHRFCRKGDKYFDPTTEILCGAEWLKAFDYKVLRVYDVDDIIDFAAEITLNDYGILHFTNSISGLTYVYKGNEDIPLFWGRINEEGFVERPNYNPFEKRAEILAA